MLLFSTDSLKGYGLNRIFQIAKEAKFDGIELVLSNIVDTRDISYVKKLSKSFELPVKVIATEKKTNKKSIRVALEMAQELKSKVVSIYPPKILNFELSSFLKKKAPLLRSKYKIIIALDNAPSENIFGILPQYAMNSSVAQKKFRYASFDTSNIYSHHKDLLSAYEELSRNIVHIHLSNVKDGKIHYFPETGILPLESFLKKLRINKYAYSISLKVNPKFFPIGDNEKVIEMLIKSRKFYEKYFKEENK